eukprot:COSAG03_NODE_1834_length_3456_cov_2.013703_2_plen_209_part_00
MLRADKPATAIDTTWSASFDSLAPIHVWGTWAQVGAARWSYLLGLNLVAPLRIPLSALDPAAAEAAAGAAADGHGGVAYEGWHGIAASAAAGSPCHAQKSCFQLLSASQELVLPSCPQVSDMTLGHTLWNVAPVLPGGWVYLGEKDKIVAASGRRLRNWNSTAPTLTLTLFAAVSRLCVSLAPLPKEPRLTSCALRVCRPPSRSRMKR